ncbi:MAG: hypothetical protein IKP40_02810 [Clostridia bacterium]|nr:hypothetical protein [Clostridia bacterium]
MMDNILVTVERCLEVMRRYVGTVETEAFIYYIKSQNFDYTKWQQRHYDSMTLEEIDAIVDQNGRDYPFQGKKAVIL